MQLSLHLSYQHACPCSIKQTCPHFYQHVARVAIAAELPAAEIAARQQGITGSDPKNNCRFKALKLFDRG